MRLYVKLDGATTAKALSLSDNPTVGEVRDALKLSAFEWLLDDGEYAQASDSRTLAGLVADGLHASGRSPEQAIQLHSIKQGVLLGMC